MCTAHIQEGEKELQVAVAMHQKVKAECKLQKIATYNS